ncbi:zinc protease [Novosphingobium chloroacetimidivorans]|uniref:Zinc protease n=1 Tax=Novosphingobium chloroacetimidivorans TaxID=1428314 RepID=A0A7W7K623_9SPHN|nr:M16 family metallopeptidase [Novosphingobium chloroacetimidivorans]MBB4856937.1 zinc protease [Novosphingobium chloroacetimidivorans]
MRACLAVLLATSALLSPPALAKDADKLARETQWAFERSDIRPDPAFRFGRLPNGLRFVIRRNANPAGTALVRMDVAVGSLDESKKERGYAHFVEHMAFNGSTHVAEGEMVRLLERHGLAFGADTNASTSFDRTLYKLDLPTNDDALLDTALMLMRETASELTIAPDAVARERGVILAEMRDRNTWQLRDTIASTQFLYPRSRFAERFPIGTAKTLDAATAEQLRAFYRREYIPQKVTLVVVGDFDPTLVERTIRSHFADWQPGKAQLQPVAGPVRTKDHGRTTIYIDPAVSERVTMVRSGPWLDEPDTVAQRRESLLRQIGYDIVNRRFLRLSRQEDPPFRGAGFGAGNVFEAGRSTRLIVDTVDRKWRRGLIAAAREYRRALIYGFSKAEVAEQVANIRTALEDAAASSDTRTNAALTGVALALVTDRVVPSLPADALARFRTLVPQITPEAVLAAMQREAVEIEDPLIRFRSRYEPAGGAKAIRAAWEEAMKAEVAQESSTDLAGFGYTDFGPAGLVVSDVREPTLGVREVRFANGVMLNLKRTAIEKDRVRASLSVDGGDRLDTKANPLATEMMPFLDEGGLGKHSADDLQTILAGRSVADSFGTGENSFDADALTTPRDLELQLQLWSAFLTDPGYRGEGEVQYRHNMNNYFEQLRATPNSALRAELGGILSDSDPRFTLQDVKAYRALTFAKLKRDVGERLAHGAIEVGVVGDIDEDQTIALVASTLGALPVREPAFHDGRDRPARTFTADRRPRIVRHSGPADQALLRLTWPTRDDADPVEALKLELLERVVRIELTDTLREALGRAYSPSAASSLSRTWSGYGTFGIAASIDVRDIAATRAAIRKTLVALRETPVDADVLQRARQPLLEGFQNGLKSNDGWLSLVDRAQSQPDRLDRYARAKERLSGITVKDVQAMAARYLDPAVGLEVLVLPNGVTEPPA